MLWPFFKYTSLPSSTPIRLIPFSKKWSITSIISLADIDSILTDAPNDGFGNYKWEGTGSIEEQIEDDCEECGTWMPASEVSRFMEFYRKCTSQPTFDADLITNPNLQPLYINSQ